MVFFLAAKRIAGIAAHIYTQIRTFVGVSPLSTLEKSNNPEFQGRYSGPFCPDSALKNQNIALYRVFHAISCVIPEFRQKQDTPLNFFHIRQPEIREAN
jgi:hypothetical protein